MIQSPATITIVKNGLWTNNPGLVQLLGLCPLLAVTTNFINGFGLGLATMLVLFGTNLTIALVRHWIRDEIRIPVFVLLIAAFVTTVELLMHAWLHDLYLILGIFIPLIVTNCVIIGRAEAFASRNPVGAASLDGLMMGLGFTAVLVLLGAMRELLGSGTLFAEAHLMFGEAAKNWTLRLTSNNQGMLLAILPPGAFLGLGMLIALKNSIDQRMALRAKATMLVGNPAASASSSSP